MPTRIGSIYGGSGSIARGVATYTGTGAPEPEPTGSQAGDVYIDTATGDLYILEG